MTYKDKLPRKVRIVKAAISSALKLLFLLIRKPFYKGFLGVFDEWLVFDCAGSSINIIVNQNEENSYTPHSGNPFYITGALSLLDAPGEYYFDPETNLLYFYPPWNGSPDSRPLHLRSFIDTVILAQDTSFVNIKNVTIFGGGINMKNTRNNVIENCRVNYAEHWRGLEFGVTGS